MYWKLIKSEIPKTCHTFQIIHNPFSLCFCALVKNAINWSRQPSAYYELTTSLCGHMRSALLRFLLLHDLGAGRIIEKGQFFCSRFCIIQWFPKSTYLVSIRAAIQNQYDIWNWKTIYLLRWVFLIRRC